MNPSTAELVAAVAQPTRTRSSCCPNNSNVILSREQAAAARRTSRSRSCHRLDPRRSRAMVSFLPERSRRERDGDGRGARGIVTGEVTLASRDAELNGIAVREGGWLGLADGEAVAVGDASTRWRTGHRALLAEPRMLLTLLTGADAPDLDGLVERIRERHPELELDVQAGGQPHYPFLLSAE
jgi:dihydroxyacetone kinase-like predicted kinase